MRIFRLLKYSFLALALLEIIGFILVGKWIGVFPTILLIIATTAFGIFTVRHLGFTMAYETMRRMHRGGLPPETDMMQGWLMFGGFLLILPGFITDTIGIILLFRPVRHWLSEKFRMRGSKFRATTVEWYEEVKSYKSDQPPEAVDREHPSRIIEGEFKKKEDDDKKE